MPQRSPLHAREGVDDDNEGGGQLPSFKIPPPSSTDSSNASWWRASGPIPTPPPRSAPTAPKPAQPIVEQQSVQEQAPTLNRPPADNEGPDRPPPPPYEGPSPSGLKNTSSSVEGRSGEGSGAVRSKTLTPTNQGGNYGAGVTTSSEISSTPPVNEATTRIQASPPVNSKPTSAESSTQRRGVTQDPANSGRGQTPPSAPAPPVSTERNVPTSAALARRLLEVTVIEAAGLLGTNKIGVSNPRVDVLLVDLAGRVVRTEGVKQTPVKTGTVCPVWNHKVVFGYRANLSSASNNLPTLRLQVREDRGG